MAKKVYILDGRNFTTLEEFYEEVRHVLIPGVYWGRNLDAFNDILRGGFGTPGGGYVLRWKNSRLSQERLGYAETVRQPEIMLSECHPLNRELVRARLHAAQNNSGPTVFDWLVEIIQVHCSGGREEDDGVELILE